MTRRFPLLILEAVAVLLLSPPTARAFDRPVLTLSSPGHVSLQSAEIQTADSIVVAGNLQSVFQTAVTTDLYHVLENGRVISEHQVTVRPSGDGAFRFKISAPRTGWTAGTLRGIVHVGEAPHVRQAFELTVVGDPVPDQIVDSLGLPKAPVETTLVLEHPPAAAKPNQARLVTSNLASFGRVFPVPASETEVELVVYHALDDGRYVVEAGLTVPLLDGGTFQANLSAPRRGWQNGRMVGVVRRKDRPGDQQLFESSIVGAPSASGPSTGHLLPEQSAITIDLRAEALPAIKAGTRYVITGESPAEPVPRERQGLPVILEMAEGRGGQAKGLQLWSRTAPTLVNESGKLEFETELDLWKNTPPGIYQIYLAPLSPNGLVSRVYNIQIVAAEAVAGDGPEPPAADKMD